MRLAGPHSTPLIGSFEEEKWNQGGRRWLMDHAVSYLTLKRSVWRGAGFTVAEGRRVLLRARRALVVLPTDMA